MLLPSSFLCTVAVFSPIPSFKKKIWQKLHALFILFIYLTDFFFTPESGSGVSSGKWFQLLPIIVAGIERCFSLSSSTSITTEPTNY
jgi:hypothetical protein